MAHVTKRIYLLHLGRSAAEQLDVALPQDLLVLLQRILGIFFTGEEHKGITGGPTVGVLDEEQTLCAICNRALGTKEGQHLLGRGGERQPPHTDDDLVLFGQELGHLVGCTCSQRTVGLNTGLQLVGKIRAVVTSTVHTTSQTKNSIFWSLTRYN